jgi:L-lactate dehydrogenase (cytochrome)
MPLALAPCGLTGMQYPDGEIHAALAAEKFGVPYTLSTMSITSIEDLADHVSTPFWFQLYVMKDHDFSKRLIQRAKAVKCSALVLTLDLQLLGQRHCDIRNGLSSPPKINIKNILEMSMKPSWCLGMLKTKRRTFGNIVGHVDGVSDTSKLSTWIGEQFDLKLNWDDISRIRDWWDGKLILKGILDPEDAILAEKIGADAIIVSNHGGRQLDDTVSSISVLPEIISVLKSDSEVWLDSGIQSGQDILKALALGAKGTMIGKTYLYGLAAAGEKGVTKVLEILSKELDVTMGLCGCRNLSEVSNKIITKKY